eukprot:CAMPEP_0195543706 /NCGR_PEP_ID=MMETSP0794_2-20130614/52253_1 /TAXON_ID=515487 /ORGANISM="Stephanopyxis turris, Strain CCMP 815" /LENGTH=357 /DNA_ID=CAMNT_0040677865 /DNA_START=48 /DNA_END=1118 /DNA_ORIENTATION=-
MIMAREQERMLERGSIQSEEDGSDDGYEERGPHLLSPYSDEDVYEEEVPPKHVEDDMIDEERENACHKHAKRKKNVLTHNVHALYPAPGTGTHRSSSSASTKDQRRNDRKRCRYHQQQKMTDSSSDHSSACNSHGFAHQYTPSSRLYPRKYSFVSPDGSLKHQFRNRHHHLHAYGKSPRLSPSLPLNERDNIHKSKDTHRSSRHHGHRQNHRNSKITNKIQNEFEIVLKSKKKEHPSGNGRATPAEEKRHDWHSSDDEEEDIPPFLLGGDGLDFDGFPLNTSTLETNKSYSLHVNDSRKGENTHSFSPSFVKGKRTTTGNAKRLQIVHEETDSVTETMTHKVKKKRKHVLPLRMRIW